MHLSELIRDLPVRAQVGDLETDITEITPDSRRAKGGSLFVAIPGTAMDGHDFIPDAIARGASAIAGSRALDPHLSLPQVQVEDPRRAMALMAARLNGDPSKHLRVIGITGTNGKTSVTFLIESILKEAGRNPAVLGTVNYRFGGRTVEAPHTTPESADLQRLFAQMLAAGVTDVVMEVSSHASAMERVRGIHFDAMGFTNLTQDHLDFHQSMDAYFAAKLNLFTDYLAGSEKKDKAAVINDEDPCGETIFRRSAGRKFRVGFKSGDEIFCDGLRLDEHGIHAAIHLPGNRKFSVSSALMGKHNLENILVAAGLAHAVGIAAESIAKGIASVRAIPGRLERIENKKNVHVFVDYAHTPDALARVCGTLKPFAQKTNGRLVTVFGCGGDRDRTKRPLMGREAGLYSDVVVVTSDNPRTEDPAAIIQDILPGIENSGLAKENLFRVVDRKEALKQAVAMARPGDFILVAGKGHEDYQIIGKTKTHFSDQEILREFLK